MKLIQIFALVAATAFGATAQSTSSTTPSSGSAQQNQKGTATSSQKTGSSAKAPVTVIVPKAATKTAGTPATPKNGVQKPLENAKTSGPKTPGPQKGPVLTVKPVVKPVPPAKDAKLAAKKPPAKTPPVPEQVTVVPQKPSDSKSSSGVAESTLGANGRRDPFISVVRNLSTSAAGPNCSVGKRCLFIPDLELKGIAKDTDGQMMAVVVSNTHRAYFLRENDQVFNGSVQKITGDSVVFREFATDHLGRETVHEVVKKLSHT